MAISSGAYRRFFRGDFAFELDCSVSSVEMLILYFNCRSQVDT